MPAAELSTPRGQHAPVEPWTLVIFGASGDLARRNLMPAVYNLQVDGVLPPNLAVIGTGRKPMQPAEFRARMREGIAKYSRRPLDPSMWSAFEPRLY